MEWINIDRDGLPKKAGRYLCYSAEGQISVEKYDPKYDILGIYCEQTDSGYATHYMELPAPPED